MELGLKGRRVLITGGSKGIGLACAQAFLDEGAAVAIVSRAQANLDAAMGALGAHRPVKAFAADIRPGRRPQGAGRPALVREYQERAGVTASTGTEI